MIDQSLGDQMHDLAFALHDAEHAKQSRTEQFAALTLYQLGMDDNVGQSRLVLQRQKDDAAGRPRTLPAGHDADAAHRTIVREAA